MSWAAMEVNMAVFSSRHPSIPLMLHNATNTIAGPLCCDLYYVSSYRGSAQVGAPILSAVSAFQAKVYDFKAFQSQSLRRL